MSNSENIMKMVESNNGTITTAEVTKAAISRGSLKYLVDKGILERSARGVYILTAVWDDEFYNLQIRFKKGIFSGETALFLYDLTDRTPKRFQMTFPLSYNTTTLKNENVKYVRVKKELYSLGVTTVLTPSGNSVKVYGIERTLCDILRGHSNTDIQVISEAFKRYAKSNKRNIPLLSEYAKKLRVDKKLQSYLEVLI
jgi:predicted transcriptional regulator of viral defense system